MQFTRPLLKQNGKFDGVVVASIDPFALSRQLNALQPSPDAEVTILRSDGVILAHNRDLESLIGKVLPPDSLGDLSHASAGSESPRSFVGKNTSGAQMALAVQRMEGWPLLIAVGVDTSASIAEAFSRKHELQFGVFIGVILIFGLGLLVEALRARKVARTAAERAETRRKEIADLLQALPGVTYRGLLGERGEWLSLDISGALERLLPEGVPPRAIAEIIMSSSLSPEQRMTRKDKLRVQSEVVSEYQIALPGGSTLWLRDQARAHYDAMQSPSLPIVGILSNVTDEKEVKARAIAAAKLATLGEMATGVAHELTQPCAAIGLAADVALVELARSKTESSNQKLRTLLESIAGQTMRLRDIVDHFRIFARSENAPDGRFSPNAAIEGALAIMRGSLQTAGIQIELNVAPHLPEVSGRLVPMEQVLVNLLLNARDAMVQASCAARRIHVGADYQSEQKIVIITVRDTGPGIPDDLRYRVFEPFFTTKPEGKGTGLGLSIAYSTLRESNGEIEIANHPSGGAVATLLLRVAPRGPGREDSFPAVCGA